MSISLPLTTKIFLDKKSSDAPYVAYCPELDVVSCGPTKEKAKVMLADAIKIVLEEAEKQGTLENYLESVGFNLEKTKMTPPEVSFELTYFPVPKVLEQKFQWLV